MSEALHALVVLQFVQFQHAKEATTSVAGGISESPWARPMRMEQGNLLSAEQHVHDWVGEPIPPTDWVGWESSWISPSQMMSLSEISLGG